MVFSESVLGFNRNLKAKANDRKTLACKPETRGFSI